MDVDGARATGSVRGGGGCHGQQALRVEVEGARATGSVRGGGWSQRNELCVYTPLFNFVFRTTFVLL